MKWPREILQGRFIRRYKRFFADVELDGEIVVAHVPNTGSMKTCIETPRQALLSVSENPARKLKYTLEALKSPSGGWIGVNTSWPNLLVRYSFQNHMIKDWQTFSEMQLEVKISPESRLDGVLIHSNGRRRYIEIKNVTMAVGSVAQFPDSVTERGQKHLRELTQLVEAGHEAEIVFVVQRTDCNQFAAAKTIDPEYARLLAEAQKAGVLVRVFGVEITAAGFQINPDHFLTVTKKTVNDDVRIQGTGAPMDPPQSREREGEEPPPCQT